MDTESTKARVDGHDRGAVLSDRYRLQRLIGAGGMGRVWEADDLVLHRKVAVKVIHSAHLADPVAGARFEREAQTAARLSHPHLAVVYDYGESDGGVYLVMELIEGENLNERLRRGPLPAAEAARVVAETAEALAAAHAAGVVHRDVKPANLMLTANGVKVMDFGIASGIGAPLTATGLIIGTASYLAPERVQGRSATPAADVYALGAVLFEALTAEPAFAGDTPAEVALGQVHGDVPDVAAEVPGVPPGIADACREALAKDPAARPSAAALAARLRRAVEEPRPPSAFGATVAAPTATAVLTGVGAVTDQHAALGPPLERPSGRGRLALLAVLLLAVAATAGVIAYALSRPDAGAGDSPVATAETAPPTTATVVPTAAPPPATTPTTSAPATTVTTAAPAPPVDQDPDAALADAALAYLAALGAGDLEAAWAMTSPEFQAQQDRGSWESFWTGFDAIEVVDSPHVEGHSAVSVPVSFDGRTERYRMTFVEADDGTWLVDGPVGRERRGGGPDHERR